MHKYGVFYHGSIAVVDCKQHTYLATAPTATRSKQDAALQGWLPVQLGDLGGPR